jgi:hypothetical protein
MNDPAMVAAVLKEAGFEATQFLASLPTRR